MYNCRYCNERIQVHANEWKDDDGSINCAKAIYDGPYKGMHLPSISKKIEEAPANVCTVENLVGIFRATGDYHTKGELRRLFERIHSTISTNTLQALLDELLDAQIVYNPSGDVGYKLVGGINRKIYGLVEWLGENPLSVEDEQ